MMLQQLMVEECRSDEFEGHSSERKISSFSNIRDQ